MIHYLEGLKKDGTLDEVHFHPTRNTSCWGLFESDEQNRSHSYRMAIMSTTGKAREIQLAFIATEFFKELTKGSDFKVLGFDDPGVFVYNRAVEHFGTAGWIKPTFMAIEFSGGAPADRIITAMRLLTTIRHHTLYNLSKDLNDLTPEDKFFGLIPVLYSLEQTNNQLTADSTVTFWPVTLAEAEKAERDEDDEDYENIMWHIQDQITVGQSNGSVLEILTRKDEDFAALSSQSGPISDGYMKDWDRYGESDSLDLPGDTVLTVNAPICNKRKDGEHRFKSMTTLLNFLRKNM